MRIVVMPPFDREFFGGDRLDMDATNLFDLVARLDARAPGFATIAEARAAFAIDGVFAPDWSLPLADACEVIVLPRVGGG
ncbi:MAG: MoaD/ThiS family protein [Novosphingobium sp.]